MKYKIGSQFIASNDDWGEDSFEVTIIAIENGKYVMNVDQITGSYMPWKNEKFIKTEHWLDSFCKPLTKLHKALK